MTYAPPPPPPPPPAAGYPAPLPQGYPAPPPGYLVPSGGTVVMPHLVHLTIDRQDKYSRGLGCLGALLFPRYIALIPVVIWLGILMFVASIVVWFMQIAVVITGHYPAGPHRFVTGVLRLSVKTNAWMLGLVDKYPGFSTKP
jgi:hypothetical protein